MRTNAVPFLDTFTSIFKDKVHCTKNEIDILKNSATDIEDPQKRQAVDDILHMVEYDCLLSTDKVERCKTSFQTLLGLQKSATEQEVLPRELQKIIQAAAPAANVKAAHYDLVFDFSEQQLPEDGCFPAKARIHLSHVQKAPLVLDIDEERIFISSVKVDKQNKPWVIQNGKIIIDADCKERITVKYKVKATDDPDSYGLVRDNHSGAMWTNFEPYHEKALFPANTQMSEHVTSTVLVKIQNNETFIGPGDPTSRARQITKPVPPYLISLYKGNVCEHQTATSESGITVTWQAFWHELDSQEQVRLTKMAAQALDFYEQKLGPYEFGKQLNIVEIKGWYGGMENLGAISLVSRFLKDDALFASRAVAHEVAHHWFGNNVRIRDWGQWWMNESFTEFVTQQFLKQQYGEYCYMSHLDCFKKYLASEYRDKPFPHKLIENPNIDMTAMEQTSIPYFYGLWVLRMLQVRFGEQTFDALLQKWYQQSSFTDITTQDFIDFIKVQTSEDITEFIEAWNNCTTVPQFLEKNVRVSSNQIHIVLDTIAAIPTNQKIPLLLKGEQGQQRWVAVDPQIENTFTTEFAITDYEWDPNQELLCQVS